MSDDEHQTTMMHWTEVNVMSPDDLNDSRRKKINSQKFEVESTNTKTGSKCQGCKQKLNCDLLRMYCGHPNDANDEYVTLIDEKLSLFNGTEEDVNKSDLRATNKITSFSVYCKKGHLCPFDSGLIEREAQIYVSGYVKPIYSENSSIEDGIPSKDIGPLVEWYITGFDKDEKVSICLVTALGEYYLMEPSDDYACFMPSVEEKTFISKTIIEFLLDDPSSEFEDLLNKFATTPMPAELPRFTVDLLIYHAQFVCDQVVSFDDSATPDEPLLIQSPCMQALIELSGVTLRKSWRKKRRHRNQVDEDWYNGLRSAKQKQPSWTKATTTKDVHSMFKSFFPNQLDDTTDKLLLKGKRCGACETCLEPDCGECSNCKNKIEYSGPETFKQACMKRQCTKIQIVEVNNEEGEEFQECNDVEDQKDGCPEASKKLMGTSRKNQRVSIEWVGEPLCTDKGDYYESVMINSEEYKKNDYVFVKSKYLSLPMEVFHIKYMQEKLGLKFFHGTWLMRGTESILGETSVSRELFLVDECQEIPLDCIQSKAHVIVHQSEDDDSIINALKENCMLLYYRKIYDYNTARFEDLPELGNSNNQRPDFCAMCAHYKKNQLFAAIQVFDKLDKLNEDGMVQYGMVKCRGEEYRVGSAVYLKPKTFQLEYLKNRGEAMNPVERDFSDEETYPEFYRKFCGETESLNTDTPPPYNIGYITGIYSTVNTKLIAGTNLRLMLKKLYRPENTHDGESLIKECDINMLYWTDEECDVQFSQLIRKCYITYVGNLDQDVNDWSAMGPDRFYFSEAYDSRNKKFIDPPPHACSIGRVSKDVNTESESIKVETHFDEPIGFPPISRKLRTLDVFSGCGGLSEGLRQSGVAENLWAIESNESAAHTYRLNYPNASVFTEDCNTFLEKVMGGETTLAGQQLPQKGEVELLCGGPPCQGFSAMNRFSSKPHASFKNSLIVSFMSFCDYYRPRYVVMENANNFASFKRGVVLKLTLSCLVRMGYQCAFGILQSGCYGVPQARKRLILLAAAPGEILPQFPYPLHVFSKSACHESIEIDDAKYITLKVTPDDSAPYRTITVYDALSDLPPIRSGYNNALMQYLDNSTTDFQRKIRKSMCDPSLLFDHICKDMGPLIDARISLIPIQDGSDWRDLPNIVVRLNDGINTNKLLYKYKDILSCSPQKGVCSCFQGKSCNPEDKQVNTLIPWCLPHTANHHNHWAGLYGRVKWNGFFSSTITNPEPMGKQGRVLHPEQHRVVSVRECARSQGFPDRFQFHGNIQDKHMQIGNAVPPPLAAAIGHELRKSLSLKEAQQASSM